MEQSILIIDDDQDITLLLDRFFKKKGYQTYTASNGEEGIVALRQSKADVVLCDFKLPDYDGLEILQKIKLINSDTQVIIITGYSDVKIAVEALKKGAFEYVTKPLFPDEILLIVENAFEKKNKLASPPDASSRTGSRAKVDHKKFIEGSTPASQALQKHIDLIAPTDMSVIILGETGTGKEYVANAIHQKSRRKSEPFIAVDCGALPGELAGSELFGHIKGAFTGALNDKEGCFEVANGGTLFLDEIGNLDYENQVKLLRVLQERKVKRLGSNKEIPVDIRIVVATNENLKESIREGSFREDIYHRLNEFTIQLTPLRERKEDIRIFLTHFLNISNEQLGKSIKGFNTEAENALINHYWHGNLRELKNVVKRAVLLCQDLKITADHLPEEIVKPDYFAFAQDDSDNENEQILDLKSVAEKAEKKAIIHVLSQTGGNKSKAADILKVDRKTLYNKMSNYNIE